MGLTMDIHPILAQLSRSRGLEGMTTVLTKMYIQDSTGGDSLGKELKVI